MKLFKTIQVFILVAVVGCASENGSILAENSEPLDTSQSDLPARNPYGTFGDFLKSKNDQNVLHGTLSTSNIQLWRASISTLGFMGFRSVLPETGTIVTEWYTSPGSDEEYQVTAIITGARLTSRNIQILSSRRQVQNKTTEAPNESLNAQLKDAILLKARELRGSS